MQKSREYFLYQARPQQASLSVSQLAFRASVCVRVYIIYACICVCMCVFMYACMYVCIHVCMYVCVHTCIHADEVLVNLGVCPQMPPLCLFVSVF